MEDRSTGRKIEEAVMVMMMVVEELLGYHSLCTVKSSRAHSAASATIEFY